MAEAENPLMKCGKVFERFFDVSEIEVQLSSALLHKRNAICKRQVTLSFQ